MFIIIANRKFMTPITTTFQNFHVRCDRLLRYVRLVISTDSPKLN